MGSGGRSNFRSDQLTAKDNQNDAEARGLRFLRRLVTVLTLVMIAGMVVLVVLLWLRLSAPPSPAFPDSVTLPEGAVPQAVTRGEGFIAVVTTDGRIFILDPTGTEIIDEVTIRLPE